MMRSLSWSALAGCVVMLVGCHKSASTVPEEQSSEGQEVVPGDGSHGELPPGLPEGCADDQLDLRPLIEAGTCDVTGEPTTVAPEALGLSLAPAPATVAAGEAASIRVYMTNQTNDPLIFDLHLGCDPALGFRGTATVDGSPVPVPTGGSEAVTEWSRWCERTSRCPGRDARFGLPAGGRAFLTLDVHARARGMNDECEDTGSDPLPEGNHVLEVAVPFPDGPRPASGVLRVTGG